MTPREYARTYNFVNDALARIAVEPPSSFAVARAQQEFGTQQSNVGASLTHVRRFVDDRGQLNRILPRNAIAGGADWRLRYIAGNVRAHWLGRRQSSGRRRRRDRGDPASSAHYFQRPDQDHISFDPTRTSLSGWTASMRADKNAGRFTLGGIQLSARSTGFDINDAGQMRSGDDVDFNADVQLRDTKPHQVLPLHPVRDVDAGRLEFRRHPAVPALQRERRSHVSQFLAAHRPRHVCTVASLSDDLTRGGPLMGTPSAYTLTTQLTSRPNVPTTWNARTEYFDDEFGGWRWDASAGIAMRPAPQWQASVDPTYSRSVDGRQYVSDARRRQRGDVRPALHLLVHRAQHVVGALPAQLRADAELHGRGIRRAVRGEWAVL